MSASEVAERTGSANTAVRAFQVGFPQAELTELRRRVSAARWPERETVTSRPGNSRNSSQKRDARQLQATAQVASSGAATQPLPQPLILCLSGRAARPGCPACLS